MNALRQIQARGLYHLTSTAFRSQTVASSSLSLNKPSQGQGFRSVQGPHISFRSLCTAAPNEKLMQRIDKAVKSGDVVVFMKGVPEAPRCGFSNAVCQIFRMHDVQITSFDVLADDELRQGMKEYSKWPTFPQVFFKGELIGGCDILLQMHQSGELIDELAKIGLKSAIELEDEPKDKK